MNEVNYSKEFIQSILAYFSYVNMDGSKDGNIQWDNLKDVDLSDTLGNVRFLENFKKYLGNKYDTISAANELANTQYILNFFMDNFTIIDQMVTRGFDGFSAVTYQLKNDLPIYGYVSGDTFVVYRGTEASQIGDLVTDFNLTFSDKANNTTTQKAINKIFDHLSQEEHGIEYLENAINYMNPTEGAIVTRKVYIAGHSLGGYLSVRSLLSLEEKYGTQYVLDHVETISTFNGAGLSVTDGWLIGKDELAALVKNFYSFRGINVTSGNFFDMFAGTGTVVSLFEHLGKRYPTATENPGGMENHNMSLLMNTFGFFSTLETIIESFPNTVTDIYDQILIGENAKLYIINQLIMNAAYVESDFGKALANISQKIIEGFGLNLDYNSSIATFMGLKEYFTIHPELKLSIYDNFKNIGLTDSNSNRSSFYSLMNDLSYVLIVPESYNEGIFKRDGESGFYNIENYSQEYLSQRIIYNKAVTELMERKLMQVLPYYIDMDGVGKYAFVVETTLYADKFLGGSAYQSTIFINANDADIANGTVKYIYMKSDQNKSLNVFKDNSIVFDTALNDTLNIYSKNNTIHSMNGIDNINIIKDSTGNIVLVEDKTDMIYIHNSAIKTDLNSLIIKFETSTSGLNINAIGLTDNFEQNRIIIQNGNQKVEVVGVFNLNLNGEIVQYKDIYSVLSNFQEMFIDGGFNINTVINQNFIDNYMELIKEKFNDGVAIPENKISERFSDYMINKLKQYSLDSNINTLDIQNNIKDKVYISKLDNTFNPEVEDIINKTTVIIEGIPFKDFVYSKLNNYADSKYNTLNTMTDEDNSEFNGSFSEKVDGMYYIKGTKNYTNYIDGQYRDYYVWDGEYYYDRVDANGEKIAAFYGDTTTAGVGYKKYLKEDLLIQDNKLFNGKQIGDVYGSDGSDIIIGGNVYGQSLYYFENGNVLDGNEKLRENGNDILIGYNVSAFSGDNLIISNDNALRIGGVLKGGRGNDLIVSNNKNTTIIADQNDVLNENLDNKNIILLLDGGKVFSSNGSNIIYSTNGIIFATGNDTVYMNSGVYYGYELDINNPKYNTQLSEISTFLTETGISFYSKYTINDKPNTIYDYGHLEAYLKEYDNISLTSLSSNIFGLGHNTFDITGTENNITSGGASLFKINGSKNSFYLNKDDEYQIIFSKENIYYARGLKDNTESSITSDNYTLSGINDKLFLGDTNYKLDLNGFQSSIVYTKNTNNLQNYNINENGITDIAFNNHTVDKIIISTKSNLNIHGGFENGIINNLDINAKVGFIPMNENIKINSLEINNLSIISADTIGLDINSEIKDALLENINIKGYITNNEIFNFKGSIDDLNIVGSELSLSKIIIEGFIKNLTMSNASKFDFIKNFNKDLLSTININSSTLETIGGMDNYNLINLNIAETSIQELILNNVVGSEFSFNNVTLNKLQISNLTASNLNLSLSNIEELYLNKYDGSSVFISGHSNSLKSNINGLQIIGTNINDFYISRTVLGTIETVLIFNANGFTNMDIKVSGENDLQLSNSTGIVNIHDGLVAGVLSNLNILNLSNVTNVYASLQNIKTINLDLDSLLNMPSFNNVENLNFITNNEIKITKMMIGDFNFNDTYNENYTLKVGNNYFTKSEIKQIRDNLVESGSYAIIKTSGIEYVQPEVTEPDLPYMDSNNIYQGTSKNDSFELTDSSKQYTLHGKTGDDIYNFKSYHYMMNTINYNSGDGLDTVNVSQYVTLTLNIDTIAVADLSFTTEANMYGMIATLNIFNNGIQIFKLNNYDKMNLTLKTLEKSYQSYEITKLMSTINGTDGNDIINGSSKNNYIYAGKGDDVINLKGYYTNEVYYNKDDGHDTVNSINTVYTVIFDSTIDNNNISYQSIGPNSFNILLDSDIIMTINEANNASLQYLSNYKTITGVSVLEDLNAIIGSELADIITVDTASIVKSKGGDDIINVNNDQAKIYAGTGNDIININYDNTGNNSTVYYEKGDGFTKVNLLKDIFNGVNIQLNNISSSQLKYEYDVNNHDTLNIYYSSGSFPATYSKIMAVENYRRVFNESYNTGRAYLNVGGMPISHTTINTQAEANYKTLINTASLMNKSMSDMNVIIEAMAATDSTDDTSVSNQSTSSILKKDE